jgi:hypothetical protein
MTPPKKPFTNPVGEVHLSTGVLAHGQSFAIAASNLSQQ